MKSINKPHNDRLCILKNKLFADHISLDCSLYGRLLRLHVCFWVEEFFFWLFLSSLSSLFFSLSLDDLLLGWILPTVACLIHMF